jgi:hypothetical protein
MLINWLNQTFWTSTLIWEFFLNSLVFNEDTDNKVKTKYQFHIDDDEYVASVMLTMSIEIQI